MDNKKQYKIALVLYTQGLDYDDRIRKEILSITKLYSNISFKIFAVDPSNREEEGITSYGVPYKILYLKSRKKYASASHKLAKAWNFFKLIKKDLNDFDAIWCADIETLLFVIFNKNKPLAWDLHELPTCFMGKKIMRVFFKYLAQRCTVMIHANEQRLICLRELNMIPEGSKQFYLRNYPQFDEIDSDYDDDFLKFEKWLGPDQCVYLQGLNEPSRAPFESISAVLKSPNLKCVVVGRVDKDAVARLNEVFGANTVRSRVYFTGMVKQLKTPQYIRKCFVSLVFYKNTCLNNWYCEANRFYQNIINGNPVITGANPPMKNIIEKFGFGISLQSDGSDELEIIEAIRRIREDYNLYKNMIDKNKDLLFWNSQNETLSKIIFNLLYEV